MNTTPSKARYIVTAFAVSLAVITYIDRVGIAVAAPLISKDLALIDDSDGLGAVRIRLGVRGLRDPWRLAGRPDRSAPRAHADRPVVVVLHRGDRMGVERALAHRHARAVRRRRGRRVPEPDARADHLAAGQGARARAGGRLARDANRAAPSRRFWWHCSSRRFRGAGRSRSSASSGSSGRSCSTGGTATSRASIRA